MSSLVCAESWRNANFAPLASVSREASTSKKTGVVILSVLASMTTRTSVTVPTLAP